MNMMLAWLSEWWQERTTKTTTDRCLHAHFFQLRVGDAKIKNKHSITRSFVYVMQMISDEEGILVVVQVQVSLVDGYCRPSSINMRKPEFSEKF